MTQDFARQAQRLLVVGHQLDGLTPPSRGMGRAEHGKNEIASA